MSIRDHSENLIIQIKNVSKWYDDFQVLCSINENIEEGSCVVICGPSGSGKSTLLRCINGLEKIQEGDIIVDGDSLVNSSTNLYRVRAKVGMVFQNFELYPHMTALKNIMLAPVKVKHIARQVAEKRAMELLELVGIPEQHNSHPEELSGGQQQRVAIARAMAMDPKIIQFDEPTSALDPEMIGEVLGVMIDLAKRGMTMLVVTHEMDFAREVADEILFVDKGRIIERGTDEAFFTNPKSERTRSFLSKILAPIGGKNPWQSQNGVQGLQES